MIRIVTDTTCDMPPEWLQRYNITRVPINIQFGQDTFHEGVTIDANTFYGRIQAEQRLPTTSQPSIGEFTEIYERLTGTASAILSIHVTSKLSGTWHTACLSARQLEHKSKIRVVDSLTGSVGLGLMVREAAQLIEAGWPVDNIAAHLEARPAQINELFMLQDLRYARMSGRVGRIRETLVSLLDIKPIVGVQDGSLKAVDKVRGLKKGLRRMIALAKAEVGKSLVDVGVVHAQAPVAAAALLSEIQACLNCRDTFITDLALSLAVHFGPGIVGFATYPVEGG